MATYKNSDTALVHLGRHLGKRAGMVNNPIQKASTVLFPNYETFCASRTKGIDYPAYGRAGTAPTFAFEESLASLEGGFNAVATCSGLAALTTALLASVKAGDHLLVVDSVYDPTRHFATQVLQPLGVEVGFYDATQPLENYLKPNTKVICVESPGSLTFEVQDIPLMATITRPRGITMIVDNTWATPLYYKPLALGADISIHACTKYILGHSDGLLGAIICRDEATWRRIKTTSCLLGQHASPEEIYAGQRGLRTLAVRLRAHEENALYIAKWLNGQSAIARVLHPALPSFPGHALWARDFTGASGLFSIVFNKDITQGQVGRFVDALKLFGIGYSWGGFESLVLPVCLKNYRTHTPWQEGAVVRLHIGLEAAEDLQADLAQALGAI
jgi:cysteine-S-conjugate beta-lyase